MFCFMVDFPVAQLDENHIFFGNEQFLVKINKNGTGLLGLETGTVNMIAVDFDFR